MSEGEHSRRDIRDLRLHPVHSTSRANGIRCCPGHSSLTQINFEVPAVKQRCSLLANTKFSLNGVSMVRA
jgi:hypothetical protein